MVDITEAPDIAVDGELLGKTVSLTALENKVAARLGERLA